MNIEDVVLELLVAQRAGELGRMEEIRQAMSPEGRDAAVRYVCAEIVDRELRSLGWDRNEER